MRRRYSRFGLDVKEKKKWVKKGVKLDENVRTEPFEEPIENHRLNLSASEKNEAGWSKNRAQMLRKQAAVARDVFSH